MDRELGLAVRNSALLPDFDMFSQRIKISLHSVNADSHNVYKVEELKSDVAKFQAGIKDALNKHIDENVGSLVKELQHKLAEKPPEHYVKFYRPTIK